MKFFSNKGQSLVEVLIVFGLAVLLLPAVLTGLVSSRNGKAQEKQRVQALTILREAEEATRSFRQAGWEVFAVDGTYQYQVAGSKWVLNAVNPPLPDANGFTESIVISSVYRETNGIIVLTPGVNDPSTKKVVTTVSWTQPDAGNVTSTKYLTRYRDNLSHVETLVDDFNNPPAASTLTNVKAQKTQGAPQIGGKDDGEIVLSQTGGYGDWCTPAGPIATLPLTGGLNAVSANQGGGDVVAFVGSGNSANGMTYAHLNITDPAHGTSPVPTVAGSVNNTPQIKTNGAYNDPSYGYLAADQHSKGGQGVVVNLTSNQIVAYLNTNTSSNGQSIFTLNNIAYLTDTDNNLYTFNLLNLSS